MAAAPVLISKRFLLIALAVCAALQVAAVRGRRIGPAIRDVAVAVSGSFQPDGWYPGEAFEHAVGVRAWGSWSGSDDNSGDITLGPFPAPRILRFGASGYPNIAGNSLQIELVGTRQRRKVETGAIGERWDTIDVELPVSWVGQPIRITGSDRAKGIGGWFALSEPIHGGRSDGNNALIESCAAWSINGLLLGLIFLASARWLIARSSLPPHWLPLAAGAIVALCGYAAFWLYFLNALVGLVFAWSVLFVGAVATVWGGTRPPSAFDDGARRFDKLKAPSLSRGRSPSTEAAVDLLTVVKLMLTVGAFYLAVLHLFPTAHDFFTLTANRFREGMPNDNTLSHTIAERLFAGKPPKDPADEWYSSDRPPLQAGWQLLTWAAGKTLDVDRRTTSGTAAMWFQLLWVAGAYGLLRTFAMPRPRAAGWIAVFALAGFFAQNTLFTWPKLAAGAFACGGIALFLFRDRIAPGAERRTLLWSALFAALGWLAHGGVAFSFLALAPWIAVRAWRGEWRAWLGPAAVFAALALPWSAYQKFYDPPGDQLLKLHFAGVQQIDPRSVWESIRDSYAKIGWREAVVHKATNFHSQVFGDWELVAQTSFENAPERRRQEFFHTGRALTWWLILALPALVWSRRRPWVRPPGDLAVLAGWLGLTIVVWCLMIFGRYNAAIHHGSYAMMIGLFVFFSVLLERAGRGWLAVLAVLQAVVFGTTYAVRSLALSGPPAGLPFVIGGGGLLAWFVVRAFGSSVGPALAAGPLSGDRDIRDGAATSAGPTWRWIAALRAWWQSPRLTIWVLLALAVLLFLRKPHALHTPQLYAEDGSIFLMQNDLHGTPALWMPYMGYLHAIPRLTAWVASHLLDPAWWPAFYNGISFAIWLAALARLFSARCDLPAKPWLALAFMLVPHTGEVFFNITNLQWITAFVLILQPMLRAPPSRAARICDAVILVLVSLTGPFVIAFLPLFAWRAWRERNADTLTALGIVLACSAVQAWFVVRTGPHFPYQDQPIDVGKIFEVIARRLVLWPLFGEKVAFGLPALAVRWFGAIFLGALTAWALRPDPRRRFRAPILVALALITAAGMYRTRPDTWPFDNLNFADRYFYIPRVLVAWLIVWEFDALPRLAAHFARAAFLAIAMVHAGHYVIFAPPNYHWADQVDPIRRGEPANIYTLPEGWFIEYQGRPKR